MTVYLSRSPMGFNDLIFSHKIGKDRQLQQTARVWSYGVWDTISRLALKFLSLFSSKYKLMKVAFKKSDYDRFQIVDDLYMTKHNLRKVLRTAAKAFALTSGDSHYMTNKDLDKITENHLIDSDQALVFEKLEFSIRKQMKALALKRKLFFQNMLYSKTRLIEDYPASLYVCYNPEKNKISLSNEKNADTIPVGTILLKSEKELIYTEHDDLYPFVPNEHFNFINYVKGSVEEYLERDEKKYGHITFKEWNKQKHYTLKFKTMENSPIDFNERQVMATIPAQEEGDSDESVPTPGHYIDVNGKSYIATSFPGLHYDNPKAGIAMFWQSIWETDSPIVVKLADKGKYWPSKKITFDHLNLTIKKKTDMWLDKPNLKLVQVELSKGDETKMVSIVDFKKWPDMSVPEPEQMKALLKQVANVEKYHADNGHKGPMTVHCKAGIGRTGTFLSIHSALGKDNVDTFKTIKTLRQQRPFGMVETVEQAAFIDEMAEFMKQPEPKSDPEPETDPAASTDDPVDADETEPKQPEAADKAAGDEAADADIEVPAAPEPAPPEGDQEGDSVKGSTDADASAVAAPLSSPKRAAGPANRRRPSRKPRVKGR